MCSGNPNLNLKMISSNPWVRVQGNLFYFENSIKKLDNSCDEIRIILSNTNVNVDRYITISSLVYWIFKRIISYYEQTTFYSGLPNFLSYVKFILSLSYLKFFRGVVIYNTLTFFCLDHYLCRFHYTFESDLFVNMCAVGTVDRKTQCN